MIQHNNKTFKLCFAKICLGEIPMNTIYSTGQFASFFNTQHCQICQHFLNLRIINIYDRFRPVSRLKSSFVLFLKFSNRRPILKSMSFSKFSNLRAILKSMVVSHFLKSACNDVTDVFSNPNQ
jgi:hypothetical protein